MIFSMTPLVGSGQAHDEVHVANFDRIDVFNSSAIGGMVRWRPRLETINKETAANDETTNAWRVAA